MKILLTVVVCGNGADGRSAPLYDGIELIYPDGGEGVKDFLARALKTAKIQRIWYALTAVSL